MSYILRQIPSPNEENPIIIKLETQEFLIGRKTPGLKGYSALSKYHALVYKSDDGTMCVKDMNSTNGVFINGKKIGADPKRLEVGNIIGFGVPNIFFTWNQKVLGFVCEFQSEEIDPEIIVEEVKIKNPVNVVIKNKKALKPHAVLNANATLNDFSNQEIESIESIQRFVNSTNSNLSEMHASDKQPVSISQEISSVTQKNDYEKRINSVGRRNETVKSNNSHNDKSSDVDDNAPKYTSSANYQDAGRVLLTDPKPMPATEKRSRGRPRKETQVENKVMDKPLDAPKFISSATYKDTGRVLLTDPKPMPVTEKRSRGRPRKEAQVENKVMDKPSDAPKYISSATYKDTGRVLLTDPRPMPATKKRCRGRPRKETQVEDKVIDRPSDAPKNISAARRNASIHVLTSETQESSESLKPLCTDEVPKKRKASVKVLQESFSSRGNFLTTETQIKPVKRNQSTSESAPLRIRIRKDNSTYKVVSNTISTDKETIPVSIENKGQNRLVQNKTISNAKSEKIPSPFTLGSRPFDSIPEISSLTAKTIHRERLKELTVLLTRCDKKK